MTAPKSRDGIIEAIESGRPFVFISEQPNGRIHVQGPADAKWLRHVLTVLLGDMADKLDTKQ